MLSGTSRRRETGRRILVADFETTTDPNDCRVWGWGSCDVETAESVWDVKIGSDIGEFIDHISGINSACYFHNLAFDGSFIIDWLFRNGYRHVQGSVGRGEFSTLISNTGKFYSITVVWENGKRTEFRDSLKKLPMSVANVAKAFKLPEAKGEIDYKASRPVGHRPTMHERTYIAHDVLIVARALKVQLASGMKKLTVGSDALHEFKTLMGKKHFDRMFPVLSELVDADIRRAYRGGWTYADPRYQGRIVGSGRVYDVNSLYPSVMYDRLLPYGEPKHFEGYPVPDEHYPLFIVSVTFTAKLKRDHVPCIQVKGFSQFISTEYQTEIRDPVTMMCTNVDLALWQDHYDLDIQSWNGGWLFHGVEGVFNDYIDKWSKVKENSDGGMRMIAKLHLNSLYGKFATNPNVTPKIPVMRDNIVQLTIAAEETREPVYTAMGVFITAYARDVTVRAAQRHYPAFAYADTDSLHLMLDDDPATLDIDPKRLGAWKFEYAYQNAIFVRAKAYIERLESGEYVTHIAGLPEKIAHAATFDDFTEGHVFTGKLRPKRVPGGIVLEETTFELHMG